MRLDLFKKSFPNLKTKFDNNIIGESSTNESGAAHQRDNDIVLANSTGGSGSKRKRQGNSDSGGKRR